MATGQMGKVLQHLRKIGILHNACGLTDGQLLEHFLAQREEAAFEALVRRHGPMVLGVCRRILGNSHDAEDAFQATFLILVRKAASFTRRETIGNWLHGVAYRTALKARAAAAKRRVKEMQGGQMRRHEVLPEEAWQELQPLLDRELNRLPDKYREPVVLCDLEGKTRREAARLLGWPEGTLSCRLARARVLLAKRLGRRGLGLSGGLLGIFLSQNAAAACVPPSLMVSTIQAAAFTAAGRAATGVISAQVAALTERVLQGMLLTKLKSVAAIVLAVGLLGLAFVAAAPPPLVADRPAAKSDPEAEPGPQGEKKTAEELQLPKGPAPVQALVRIDKEGQLAVRTAVTKYRAVQALDGAGRKITAYLPEAGMKTERFARNKVRVYDTHGKKIEPKTLRGLLPKERPALVSADGEKVDPLHLRLIKEGTLVFVLPKPKAQAASPMMGLPGGMPGMGGGAGGGAFPVLPRFPGMPPGFQPPAKPAPMGGGAPGFGPPGGPQGPAVSPPGAKP